jgi:hypothetical protein
MLTRTNLRDKVEFFIEVHTREYALYPYYALFYPYKRGERRLVINTKKSAYNVDVRLVHYANISAF